MVHVHQPDDGRRAWRSLVRDGAGEGRTAQPAVADDHRGLRRRVVGRRQTRSSDAPTAAVFVIEPGGRGRRRQRDRHDLRRSERSHRAHRLTRDDEHVPCDAVGAASCSPPGTGSRRDHDVRRARVPVFVTVSVYANGRRTTTGLRGTLLRQRQADARAGRHERGRHRVSVVPKDRIRLVAADRCGRHENRAITRDRVGRGTTPPSHRPESCRARS